VLQAKIDEQQLQIDELERYMSELTSIVERQLQQLKQANKFCSNVGLGTDDLAVAFATEVQAFAQQRKRVPVPVLDDVQCDAALQKCIDYLYHFVLTVNLFAKRTDDPAVQLIAGALARGGDVDISDVADPHIVANALLLYFSGLDTALVPGSETFVAVMRNEKSAQMAAFKLHEVVNKLPSKTRNTMKELFALLGEIAKEHETNRMTADRLGEIVGIALFKTSSAITSACECMILNERLVFEAAKSNRVFRESKDQFAGNSAWKQYDGAMYARGNVGSKPSFAGHSGN
jgi:chorismate mutase